MCLKERFARKRVGGSEKLFEEREGKADRMVKRVVVEGTEGGGAAFVLLEKWERGSGSRGSVGSVVGGTAK